MLVDLGASSASSESNSKTTTAPAKVLKRVFVGSSVNSLDVTDDGGMLAVGTQANAAMLYRISANYVTQDSVTKEVERGRQMFIKWSTEQLAQAQHRLHAEGQDLAVARGGSMRTGSFVRRSMEAIDYFTKQKLTLADLRLKEAMGYFTKKKLMSADLRLKIIVSPPSRFTYGSAVTSVSLSGSGFVLRSCLTQHNHALPPFFCRDTVAVAADKHTYCYCTMSQAPLHSHQSSGRVKAVALSNDGSQVCFGGWSKRFCFQLISS